MYVVVKNYAERFNIMKMKTNLNAGLLTWRLTLGILMILHGVHKLIYGLDFIEGLLTELGLPAFFALGVYVGEIVAPLLLIIGFRTKIAALILAFTMATAVWMVHLEDIFLLAASGAWAIEAAALFMFGAIGLVFTGGGKYALSTRSKWD